MFLEMKEHTERKGNGRLVVGYDLGNENSQISYCYLNSDTPETLSGVAGGESYHIPTALCRKKGVNQWFYGKEAVRYAKEEGGILIRRLPDLAKEGEKVTVEEDEVDPVALLSLFMKRSLNMLSVIEPADKIEAIMVTCEDMDQNMTEVLNQAVAGMGLKTKRVIFQNYMESFYAYVLHQPEELWKQQVLLCDYHEDYLKIYRMECNRHTTPVVAFVEKMHFPAMVMRKLPEGDFARARSERQLMIQEMDRQFLTIMEQVCGSRFISSVYLIGTGFSEEWMKDSLKFLCKGRRVFQGNNLYSKGSCYSIKEQIVPTELSSGFVFLGEEKLKSNIGMKVLRKGVDSYLALLDAGTNWFDARRECEIMLPADNSFEMMSTPLNGREIKVVEISPEGLPERPPGTTRLKLEIYMVSPETVHIKMTDEGFGELYPSTDMVWDEEFEV